MSRADVAALLASHAELKQQVEWFKRQLFGSKSERRPVASSGDQLWLGEPTATDAASSPREITVNAHTRRGSPSRSRSDEARIRFDASVPVETVEIPNLEVLSLMYVDISMPGLARIKEEHPGIKIVM